MSGSVYFQLDSVLMKTKSKAEAEWYRKPKKQKAMPSSTQDIIQNVGSEKLLKGGKSILWFSFLDEEKKRKTLH